MFKFVVLNTLTEKFVEIILKGVALTPFIEKKRAKRFPEGRSSDTLLIINEL